MTKERIYDLAYSKALDIWYMESEHMQEHPEDPIAKTFERQAWEEAEEIRALLNEIRFADKTC